MGLGAMLREAREEKSISLEQLQESTKIQKRYLTAIEEENYKILPGTFYAKAFIKEYALAVGLDPVELLDMYQADSPDKQEQEQDQQYTRIQSRREGTPQKTSAIFSLIPMVIVVVLIIGIIFAGVYFYKQNISKGESGSEKPKSDNEIVLDGPDDGDDQQGQDSETNKKDSEGNEKSDEKEEKKDHVELKLTEQGSGPKPESTYELTQSGDELQVKLESENQTWIQVSNGQGETNYSGTLTSDQSPTDIDMNGDKEINFILGNTAATITINGVKLDLPEELKEQNVVQKIKVNVKK